MSERIDLPFAVVLGIAALWTTLFSLSVSPAVRGYRNFGLMVPYVSLVIFLFVAGWSRALTTWALFGVAGGLLYLIWEIVQRVRTPAGEEKPPIGVSHLAFGLVAWPIMMPEAIEYLLAELGILSAPPPSVEAPQIVVEESEEGQPPADA